MKKRIFIDDSNIHCDFYSFSQDLKPLIIFSHGFKGFKDWGGFPYFLNKIAETGFCTAGFNFTHNGVTNENPMEFSRLDLFADNTFSREIDELGSVISYFYNNRKQFNIDTGKIGLIGHSRGGGISILRAADDKRIKCLITLASVSGFDRYSEKFKLEWKKRGYFETENTRTKQLMRLNASLLDDIEKNKEKLDILSAAAKLKIPSLFIHGKEDLAVKFTEAEQIFNATDKVNKELLVIENTGHTFGIVHPFSGTTPAFENVIEKSTRFLNKYLL